MRSWRCENHRRDCYWRTIGSMGFHRLAGRLSQHVWWHRCKCGVHCSRIRVRLCTCKHYNTSMHCTQPHTHTHTICRSYMLLWFEACCTINRQVGVFSWYSLPFWINTISFCYVLDNAVVLHSSWSTTTIYNESGVEVAMITVPAE